MGIHDIILQMYVMHDVGYGLERSFALRCPLHVGSGYHTVYRGGKREYFRGLVSDESFWHKQSYS